MSSSQDKYKLIYTVLESHLEATKKAVFDAGAGTWDNGKYTQVCFEIKGNGQFLAMAEAGADPHTGSVGVLEKVEEIRVEMLCVGREVTQKAVDALKK